MAIPKIIGRWFTWALLATALVLVLGGCTQRDATNPFIGPNGASTSQPFG